MKKIVLTICMSFICLLTGCTAKTPAEKQYKATFLDVFDTVTSMLGYAETEEAFQETAENIHQELMEYHQLFDIYHTYDGINNLKTINDQAGIAPVEVDERIIELLLDCREFYEVTGGKVNVAMGSVLSLWHEARDHGRNNPDQAKLPDQDKLTEAGKHTSFDLVEIDQEANTVFLSDPEARLDVGAIAKGWSAQKVAEHAPDRMLISVGGNICGTGPKDDQGTPWVVGIQDPDKRENEYLHTVYVTQGCVVTSGDYQRAYTVDGKTYHHIIDPETLYPSEYWRAVSVVCRDSGAADMLSTALFLQSAEDGQKLLDQYDAEAMWVNYDGTILYSPGFKELLRT